MEIDDWAAHRAEQARHVAAKLKEREMEAKRFMDAADKRKSKETEQMLELQTYKEQCEHAKKQNESAMAEFEVQCKEHM